jgi:hypothetical protein
MTMKVSTVIFFLILANYSISQTVDSTFLRFDLNKFDILKEKGLNHYYLEDSTKIVFQESNEIYQTQMFEKNSHYSKVYQYYKTTLTLQRTGEYFQRNRIGIHKKYNQDGLLTEELKTDSMFKFTLTQLNEKLLAEYNIDIKNTKKVIGVSMETSFKPIYNISYSISGNPYGIWRFLQFDGVTGQLLQDFGKAYECKAK